MTEAGVLRCASFFMEIFKSTSFNGCRLMGESEFLCSFAEIYVREGWFMSSFVDL